jgi:hypothetical protein
MRPQQPRPFCWWCGKPLSVWNRPDGTPWATLVAIEPGRVVKVHKTCAADTRASLRQLTATPPQPHKLSYRAMGWALAWKRRRSRRASRPQ